MAYGANSFVRDVTFKHVKPLETDLKKVGKDVRNMQTDVRMIKMQMNHNQKLILEKFQNLEVQVKDLST
ncbi:hypothetical protein KFL_001360030 [Klebsormidium nitens]|uniref:Uncharacterized protein n=1 Tax=Klebsormidium nitens TaxID=105231 RepID=A0A1Y1I2X8_KLENI|nr:hypothetical protein KFL_001360030 [Klebsormidium nitens]|eukprot:GAQ83107.1 hypothetical protein KFL_001360030 [Klebsormidium nitens]